MKPPYLPQYYANWLMDQGDRLVGLRGDFDFGTATPVPAKRPAPGAVPAPPAPKAGVSEKAFQADVVKLATLAGWAVYHTFDSRRSQKGFPDLVLVRERVIVAELKAETGKLTPEQDVWLDLFRVAKVSAFVWRPSQWAEIVGVLTEVRG
jgi:hypothetical protein